MSESTSSLFTVHEIGPILSCRSEMQWSGWREWCLVEFQGFFVSLLIFKNLHSPIPCLFPPTVPNPPLNISLKITQLRDRPELPGTHDWLLRRSGRNVPLMGKQEQAGTLEEEVEPMDYPDPRGPVDPVQSLNGSMDGFSVNGTEDVNSTQPYWPDSTTSTAPAEQEGRDSVNVPFSEYEDSPELGSAGGPALFPSSIPLPTRGSPMLLELRWLPPRPPTAFDGFKIYIYKDGESTGDHKIPKLHVQAPVCRPLMFMKQTVVKDRSQNIPTFLVNTLVECAL